MYLPKTFGNDPQNPNALYYNWKNSGWDTTWKFSGQYDPPYGLKYSSGFLAQSGNYYNRSAQMLNARNATVTVTVEGRAGRYPYVKLWDNRIAETFRIGDRHTIEGMFDLFNSLNSSAVTAQGNTNGPNYLKPTTIIAPRVFRIGARWKF